MDKNTTEIKTPFLSGITIHIAGDFLTRAGLGYEPDTVLMSVYDVIESRTIPCPSFHVSHPTGRCNPVSSSFINDRNRVDVSAYVDSSGVVDLNLDVEDSEIDVPAYVTHLPHKRIVSFLFQWASPAITGKHRIVIPIIPDRETVAT